MIDAVDWLPIMYSSGRSRINNTWVLKTLMSWYRIQEEVCCTLLMTVRGIVLGHPKVLLFSWLDALIGDVDAEAEPNNVILMTLQWGCSYITDNKTTG